MMMKTRPWLIGGSIPVPDPRGLRKSLLKHFAYRDRSKTTLQWRGDVNTNYEPIPEQRGFTTADILWAIGIWSVILCLSPVIVFYVLMVA